MTNEERRQAKRIVRNLRAAKVRIDMLIFDLEGEADQEGEPYDWEQARSQQRVIHSHLRLVEDLIANSAREMPLAPSVVAIVIGHEGGGPA